MPYGQSLLDAIFLSETPLTSAPLLYINGFPGVCKLTFAREIVNILGFDKCVLLDSHTLIEPLNAQYPRDQPDYQKARKAERERQSEAVVKNPEYKDHLIILTGELAELFGSVRVTDLKAESCSNVDWEVEIAAAFVNAAQEARRPFLSIVLTCDLEENLRRIATEERKQSDTTRLTDCDRLRSKREMEEIYKFDTESEFILEITALEPQTAAEQVAEWTNRKEWRRRHQDRSRRYYPQPQERLNGTSSGKYRGVT